MRRNFRKLALVSSCLLFAAAVASAFAFAALQTEKYALSDVIIGAVWVFTLSLIISSPLLIPRIKKRLRSVS